MQDRDLPTLAEWLRKAEDDLRSAAHLLKIRSCPTEVVCFHAQQCVEKYLKGLLFAQGVDFPRVHEITALMALVPERVRPELSVDEQERLTDFAVIVRYPGMDQPIALREARHAVAVARRLRTEIRRLLPRAAVRRCKTS
ncbi:MAG: HEPN domain-containing protein [Planctomycetota bacterium]